MIWAVSTPCLKPIFTAQKPTQATRDKSFQSAKVWGPGDFGSWFQYRSGSSWAVIHAIYFSPMGLPP